jgi:CHASE1-domain containing sensor protein
MSEYEKDTAFLKQCLLYVDSAERHQLEEGITRVQRDERCVRRAVWLMALLASLAMAGLCYAGFLVDSPQNLAQFIKPFIMKVFCALGVGSLICLLAFMALGVVYRKELDQRREECRRLATKLLEARLGKPRSIMPLPGVVKEANL